MKAPEPIASEPVRFQLGTGQSTLHTVKVIHLSPQQRNELVEWLQIQFGARRC